LRRRRKWERSGKRKKKRSVSYDRERGVGKRIRGGGKGGEDAPLTKGKKKG